MSLIHCPECGEKISRNALNCPHCGEPDPNKIDQIKGNESPQPTRQIIENYTAWENKSRYVAAFYAILLGVFGAHHFYMGKKGRGFIYIVLALFTAGILPWFLGILEGIELLVMSERRFKEIVNNKKKSLTL